MLKLTKTLNVHINIELQYNKLECF